MYVTTTPTNEVKVINMTTETQNVKVQPPVKTALAISKRDFYQWLDNQSYGYRTHIASSPISGHDIFVSQPDDKHMGEFLHLPTALLIRPECETNEDFLQVLPYIILRVKPKNDAVEISHLYKYMRPVKGTEVRLHDLYSIGFGGHIEEQPNKDKNFAEVIIDCAIRELEEEVNTKLTREQLVKAFSNAVIMHDTSNAVGRVHLCVALFVDVSEDKVGEPDPKEVANFGTSRRQLLLDAHAHGELQLEPWSNHLLTHFEQNFTAV